MTARHERTHAARLGERQGLAVVSLPARPGERVQAPVERAPDRRAVPACGRTGARGGVAHDDMLELIVSCEREFGIELDPRALLRADALTSARGLAQVVQSALAA